MNSIIQTQGIHHITLNGANKKVKGFNSIKAHKIDHLLKDYTNYFD